MPDDEITPSSESHDAPEEESPETEVLDKIRDAAEKAEADASGEADDGSVDIADAENPVTAESTADGDADPDTDEEVDNSEGEENEEEDADTEGEEEGSDGEDAGEQNAEEEESALPLASVVEAVLFAAREPLKIAQIARAVGKRTRQEAVREAIAELNVHYLETSRAFEIAEISGRYQLMSRPEFSPHIMRIYPKRDLVEKDKAQRLTPAALDTLAIIAYKQPVTRGDIEHIRGVGCGPVLRALIERGSVRVAGKRTDLVGQPLVYGTTEAFLAEFGLGTLEELPLRNEFLGMLGSEDIAVEYNEPEAGENKNAEQPAPDSEEEAIPEDTVSCDKTADTDGGAFSGVTAGDDEPESAPSNDSGQALL